MTNKSKTETLWSVETKVNMYNDDEFNGTYEECIEYCKKNEYTIDGNEARLALIVIDKNGIVTDTLEIINEAI